MANSYQDLARRLAMRTTQGRVKWQRTAREDEFIVYFESYALSVRLTAPVHDPDYCTFAIRNITGEEVDRFIVEEGDELWPLARNLWAGARRKALRIDEALAGILEELDTKEIIGEEAPTLTDEDEETPF